MNVSDLASKVSHFGPYVIVALMAKEPTLKVAGSEKVSSSPILNSLSTKGSVKLGGVVESWGGGVLVMLTVIV